MVVAPSNRGNDSVNCKEALFFTTLLPGQMADRLLHQFPHQQWEYSFYNNVESV